MHHDDTGHSPSNDVSTGRLVVLAPLCGFFAWSSGLKLVGAWQSGVICPYRRSCISWEENYWEMVLDCTMHGLLIVACSAVVLLGLARLWRRLKTH